MLGRSFIPRCRSSLWSRSLLNHTHSYERQNVVPCLRSSAGGRTTFIENRANPTLAFLSPHTNCFHIPFAFPPLRCSPARTQENAVFAQWVTACGEWSHRTASQKSNFPEQDLCWSELAPGLRGYIHPHLLPIARARRVVICLLRRCNCFRWRARQHETRLRKKVKRPHPPLIHSIFPSSSLVCLTPRVPHFDLDHRFIIPSRLGLFLLVRDMAEK